ncbi:DUF1064 domain-containing protein [Ligilactobacillus acidipiscis]|uniref:DUF1064 domain-containing protein n=1 Tax=Ligilactobacillus acidipiscis TaxID=89059 RepID=UPI0022E5AE24|nr:DUF1064 domain-containing protein [Ligilactobacillus acidipiscis]
MANKAGTHFGQKVRCSDGYTFDSKKEHEFYHRYIKTSKYDFKCHPNFKIKDMFTVGGTNFRGMSYKPDFVLYGETGGLEHVIDVKNSLTPYGVSNDAKNRFKLFADRYQIPVEVCVPRSKNFKQMIFGTTTRYDPLIFTTFDYSVFDLIGR